MGGHVRCRTRRPTPYARPNHQRYREALVEGGNRGVGVDPRSGGRHRAFERPRKRRGEGRPGLKKAFTKPLSSGCSFWSFLMFGISQKHLFRAISEKNSSRK